MKNIFSFGMACALYRNIRKKGLDMKNMKMKIMEKIVDLRYEMDNYREMRMFGKIAEIRLEIARLEALLSETY